MARLLAIILAFFATAALPQDAAATGGETEDAAELSPLDRWRADKTIVFDAAEIDLADFQWVARPVVVFADSPQNPLFADQLQLLLDRVDDLALRDVVLITDTDPEGRSALRLSLRPRGFMLTIIGKDGEVEIRKPAPWSVREISRTIDKMPLRQREIREGR